MIEAQKHTDSIIGEDVCKEARVLRFLGRQACDDNEAAFSLTHAHIDQSTCGLSDAYLAKHSDLATGKLSSNAVLEINQERTVYSFFVG